MIYQGKARYPVREVILHCTAVPTGFWKGKSPFQAFAEINRWHVEKNGWKAIGYHALFMPDGTYYSGRPFSQIGAHCIGHNQGTLGFVLLESTKITQMGRFEDFYTEAQRDAVRAHLRVIDGIERVSGHNDYAPKLCPGFHVKTHDWL